MLYIKLKGRVAIRLFLLTKFTAVKKIGLSQKNEIALSKFDNNDKLFLRIGV